MQRVNDVIPKIMSALNNRTYDSKLVFEVPYHEVFKYFNSQYYKVVYLAALNTICFPSTAYFHADLKRKLLEQFKGEPTTSLKIFIEKNK
jgi:hypothetical protein